MMRPEVLERLRQTMRGGRASKPVGTVGTSEPAPVPAKVPTGTNKAFQSEALRVPTGPTVPTHFCRDKKETEILPVLASERASEPGWKASAKVLAYEPKALQAEADRRNRAASAAGWTDRFCACGNLAPIAVRRFKASPGNREGVAQWLCEACFGEWQRLEAGAPSLKLPEELEPHLRLNPVFKWFVQKGSLPTVEEYIGANRWGEPPLEEYDEYEQGFIKLLKKHQPAA